MEVKIQKIGNSLGVILPDELIKELQLKSGDTLRLGRKWTALEIQQNEKEFEVWSEAYQQLNTHYEEVLKALAK